MDSREHFPSIRGRMRLYERNESGNSSTKNSDYRRAQYTELAETVGCGMASIAERRQAFEGRYDLNESVNSSLTGPGLVSLAVFEEDKFSVNDKELQRFLKNDTLKGRPLVIVSIAGTFRSGKSFIMNFFIRYLQEKGWSNPDWFGEGDDKIADGFEWRRGSVACTKGIHVWSDVFYVPLNDGREAAVLLVDTQGLFDDDTSPDTNAKIMSISTLFSSHQILNLMRQIEERDLEHLQLCAAFSKAAMSTRESGQSKPFQTLTFLVRDWEFEYDYGDSTHGYLKKYFGKQSSSKDVQKVKDSIQAAFSDVKCFLLPNPGKRVTRSDGMNLLNKDMDEDFQEFTKQLVEAVFHPSNLVVKRTRDGEEATADDLLHMVSLVGKSFSNGEIPRAKTLLQYMAGTNNAKAIKEATVAYKERLRELCQGYSSASILKDNHERSLRLAKMQFRYMASMGDEADKVECLSQLKIKCEEEFEYFQLFRDDVQKEEDSVPLADLSEFVRNYRKIDTKLKILTPTERDNKKI